MLARNLNFKFQGSSVVDLFERQCAVFDISTPLGAWRYTTALARIAQWGCDELMEKFNSLDHFKEEKLFNAKFPKLVEWSMYRQKKLFIPKESQGAAGAEAIGAAEAARVGKATNKNDDNDDNDGEEYGDEYD